MAFSIRPIEEDQCARLSYEGEMPPEEIAAARYEAHGLLKTRCWSRMMVDLTQLRSVPTAAQLFDFAKGFAGQMPPDARVALVVRPEQVRHANLVEKVARKDGVFLSYFLDPREAALWIQRDQAFRLKLGPEPGFQKGPLCKPHPTISNAGAGPCTPLTTSPSRSLQPPRTATSDITRGPRQATIAET